jgi:hypothetical protein
MSRDRLRLAAAVGLQLLILALVPARPVLAAWRGQEVTLATAPVDPYDPFSGAYVRLGYEVERPEAGLVPPELEDGQTIYLVVERADPAWRLTAVAVEPPPPSPDRAALRATWRHGVPRLESASRLYLPDERARAAEAALAEQRQRWWHEREEARRALPKGAPEPESPPSPRALVDLRVDESGNVRLRRLRVDGQLFGD